jgi:phytoene dehydrogenase-like protein
MRIITIGSGIAGLTAAAVFAQAGHDTTVFEQYHQVGGVTAPIERDGYKWDLGQLIIEGMGPNEPIGSILAELGLSEQVKIRKEDRGYVFPDFELKKPLDYKSPSSRIEQLKELLPSIHSINDYRPPVRTYQWIRGITRESTDVSQSVTILTQEELECTEISR